MTLLAYPALRAKSLEPVDRSLQQQDTLRSVKQFFEGLLRDGSADLDPRRLYSGVCDALGERPKPDLVEGVTT